VIARTAARIFLPTGSIVVRERPDAAKVAHFRQMLRDGSKRPPIDHEIPRCQMGSSAPDDGTSTTAITALPRRGLKALRIAAVVVSLAT
jgi:hypothetical protein